MIEPTTDDNAINHFQTIRDLRDNIEELHARGLDDRADAAMFTIKELLLKILRKVSLNKENLLLTLNLFTLFVV